MQTTNTNRSATILAFPTAKRRAAVFLGKQAKFAAEVAALSERQVDFEGGWYHQDAIEEAAGRNN